VGSRRPGEGRDEEKRRSGVKTHTRREGVMGWMSSSGAELVLDGVKSVLVGVGFVVSDTVSVLAVTESTVIRVGSVVASSGSVEVGVKSVVAGVGSTLRIGRSMLAGTVSIVIDTGSILADSSSALSALDARTDAGVG
jgi:hypothetical protein